MGKLKAEDALWLLNKAILRNIASLRIYTERNAGLQFCKSGTEGN